MTEHDSTDVEALVRRALQAHAADPRTGALDEGYAQHVLGRGRAVRRRRQVAGGVGGALATIAVVGSVWGLMGHHADEAYDPARPSTTTSATTARTGLDAVRPRADLTASGVVVRQPAGADVALPKDVRHVLGLQSAGRALVVLGSTGDRGLATGGTQSLYVVNGGSVRVIASGTIPSFGLSADGTKVAYAVGTAGAGGIEPKIRDAATGELIDSAQFPDPVSSVSSVVWDGAEALFTGSAQEKQALYRWTPGEGVVAAQDGTGAVRVPGGRALVGVRSDAAGGKECLRRAGTTKDLVCGYGLSAVASADGASVIVGGLSERTAATASVVYARIDLGSDAVTALAVPAGLAADPARAADWGSLTWAGPAPVVRVPAAGGSSRQWHVIDPRTGAMTPAPLPAGVTQSIRW